MINLKILELKFFIFNIIQIVIAYIIMYNVSKGFKLFLRALYLSEVVFIFHNRIDHSEYRLIAVRCTCIVCDIVVLLILNAISKIVYMYRMSSIIIIIWLLLSVVLLIKILRSLSPVNATVCNTWELCRIYQWGEGGGGGCGGGV